MIEENVVSAAGAASDLLPMEFKRRFLKPVIFPN
jgi:hypothetical protein